MPASSAPDLAKLDRLVERLRGPDGCPWDRKQTLRSIRPYLIEEAHEVAAAIDAEDDSLAEELGDLLFQIVFLARLGHEQGRFDLAEVIDRIHDKMVLRHPHVFGEVGDPASATSGMAQDKPKDADAVVQSWERRKLREAGPDRSLLAGVPSSLPALVASYRLTQKAAGVGFDWQRPEQVVDKIREELGEVEEALARLDGSTQGEQSEASEEDDRPRDELSEGLNEELGDLLLSVANLARHLDFDPEASLAAANLKFRRRFTAMESDLVAHGQRLENSDLAAMEAAWQRVKAAEHSSSGEVSSSAE